MLHYTLPLVKQVHDNPPLTARYTIERVETKQRKDDIRTARQRTDLDKTNHRVTEGSKTLLKTKTKLEESLAVNLKQTREATEGLKTTGQKIKALASLEENVVINSRQTRETTSGLKATDQKVQSLASNLGEGLIGVVKSARDNTSELTEVKRNATWQKRLIDGSAQKIGSVERMVLNNKNKADKNHTDLELAANNHTNHLKMASYAFEGNSWLRMDATAEDMDKDDLNGAAAGAYTKDMWIAISADLLNDEYLNNTLADFEPKIVLSKSVNDADIGDLTYYVKDNPPTALTGTIAWDGSLVVALDDTSQIQVGDAIGDKFPLFKIVSLVEDTSATVVNPHGYTVPNGPTTAFKGVLPKLINGALQLTVVFDTDEGSTKTWIATDWMKLQAKVREDDTWLGHDVASITKTWTAIT